MKRRKLHIAGAACLAVILVISSLITACTTEPTEKTLKIGVLFSLTGPGSDIEVVFSKGVELAKDWINEGGGITINGDKYLIELIVEDEKSNPDGAVAAATKLVHQDGVKFIVGSIVSAFTEAESTVTEPAKVLHVLCWGGNGLHEINPDKPYSFRTVMGGADVISYNYDYLVEGYSNLERIAIVYPDAGSDYTMATSEKEAVAHGLEVVATELYPWGTEDYYPVWTKLLAGKPDAVDMGQSSPLIGASLLKQGRELGFTGPAFQCTPIDLYIVREIAGQEFAYNYFNPSLDANNPQAPAGLKDIAQRWADKYGIPFTYECALGWDSFWCLTQAIEQAQSLDPTDVKDAWEKMESIETTWGPAHMGGLQTFGVNHLVVRRQSISRLENGEVEFVKWYMPEIP